MLSSYFFFQVTCSCHHHAEHHLQPTNMGAPSHSDLIADMQALAVVMMYLFFKMIFVAIYTGDGCVRGPLSHLSLSLCFPVLPHSLCAFFFLLPLCETATGRGNTGDVAAPEVSVHVPVMYCICNAVVHSWLRWTLCSCTYRS